MITHHPRSLSGEQEETEEHREESNNSLVSFYSDGMATWPYA